MHIFASSYLYIFSVMFFVKEKKRKKRKVEHTCIYSMSCFLKKKNQAIYDHIPYLSLAEYIAG